MRKFAIVEKQFQYKGHDCICVFTRNGVRCGYVSTKWHCGYDDFDIDCHGGLTFSGALPESYAPKEEFYIGFDCGHCCDGIDIKLAYEYGLVDETEREYFEEYNMGYRMIDSKENEILTAAVDATFRGAVLRLAEKLKQCSYYDNCFKDGKWHRYVFVEDIDETAKKFLESET